MPWDFYRLTMREFMYRYDGFWRDQDRQGVLAYRTACLMNASQPAELWRWLGRWPVCFPQVDDGPDSDEP